MFTTSLNLFKIESNEGSGTNFIIAVPMSVSIPKDANEREVNIMKGKEF
jgi:hypothetical protein